MKRAMRHLARHCVIAGLTLWLADLGWDQLACAVATIGVALAVDDCWH